jgi:YHS domain-containing protein
MVSGTLLRTSTDNMKAIKNITVTILSTALVAAPFTVLAAEGKDAKPKKPYPLETCAVSGEKLGGMGEPFVFVHETQEIQLCCKSCKKDFDKEPAKYMAKVTEANKKVKPYKLDTCVVSGEKLGEEPHAIVAKGQEVKFCCKDCAKEFNKDAAKYLAKIK